jgi:SAM-dependent methyltransferase
MNANRKPSELSAVAIAIGKKLKLKERLLMRYRPYICPFHVLMQYVGTDSRVLDVGCGSGLWLYLLSRLKMIAYGVGVEVNADKIACADSLKNPNDTLEFYHLPAEHDWPNVKCDVLTMIDVLHHIPPQQQREFICRIDKSGIKTVIFKDVDPAAGLKSVMNSVHDLVLSHQLPHYCSRGKIAKWLEEIGFSIVRNERCDMLWYSHYVIVAERK